MGETSGAGGACAGADQVIGKFIGVFWYADKLGVAAATGHSVVAKQEFKDLVVSLPGGGVRATPGYWVAALWKKLMGASNLHSDRHSDRAPPAL